eukprot:Gb_36930 [translate_table: standard]
MELPSERPDLHLCALAVFRNLLNEELIKSIHMYEHEDGRMSAIQREFMFCPSSYKQIGDNPVHACEMESIEQFMENLQEGEERGLWICILHYNCNRPPTKTPIPNVLDLARNPALKTLPELAMDLDKVTRFRQTIESARPQKNLDSNVFRANSTDRECESVDMQSNFFSMEGFWPAIHSLTTVPFAFEDCINGEYPVAWNRSICPIDNYDRSQPINRHLPVLIEHHIEVVHMAIVKLAFISCAGYSFCNTNEANFVTGDNPRCLVKKICKTDNQSRLNTEDEAVSQSPDLCDDETSHALDDPDVDTSASKDLSMPCNRNSISGICGSPSGATDQKMTSSLKEDRSGRIHRAPTKRVADIALKDLAKYFDVPITEASRNLKVGLTVLKKKCREFGIPRWPHRKIKSLDSLIQNLQGYNECNVTRVSHCILPASTVSLVCWLLKKTNGRSSVMMHTNKAIALNLGHAFLC